MFGSKIADIKIPMLIPRRGRGHIEALCSFEISSLLSEFDDPVDFVQIFTPLAKTTLGVDTFNIISDQLKNRKNLLNASVHVNFENYLDRVSSTYDTSYFKFICGYDFLFTVSPKSRISIFKIPKMYIIFPIWIKDIVSTLNAELKLEVTSGYGFYFEDLADIAQKVAASPLYPIVKKEDKVEFIEKHMKVPYDVYTILNNLKKICKNKISNMPGSATIYIRDMYSMYSIQHIFSW